MRMLKSAATLAVLLLGLAACDSGHNSDEDENEAQAFDALVYEVLDEDADADAVDLNERKLTVLSDDDEEVFSALF